MAMHRGKAQCASRRRMTSCPRRNIQTLTWLPWPQDWIESPRQLVLISSHGMPNKAVAGYSFIDSAYRYDRFQLASNP